MISILRIKDQLKQRLYSVHERLCSWTTICQEHSMCGSSSHSKKNSLDNLLGFWVSMAFNMTWMEIPIWRSYHGNWGQGERKVFSLSHKMKHILGRHVINQFEWNPGNSTGDLQSRKSLCSLGVSTEALKGSCHFNQLYRMRCKINLIHGLQVQEWKNEVLSNSRWSLIQFLLSEPLFFVPHYFVLELSGAVRKPVLKNSQS